MSARAANRWGWRLLNAYGALFIVFLYGPLLLILIYSFNSNRINMAIWSGFTLDWYRSIFGLTTSLDSDAFYVESTGQLLAAVRNSFVVALFASTISTAIGTAAALALARYSFRLRNFYQALLFLPMMMPDIVLGIALLVFFVGVGLQLGIATIVIGHCTFLASYVFIVVSARLAGMDTQIEEASADLGAGPWTTFRRITLPQIMPGVIGGFLLAFIISLDDVVITYFISGVDSQTLPLFVFSMMRRGIKPEINAIAMLLVVFSFVVAATGLFLRSRRA
ncbi:MAG TPA: ABC transporter permease [Afifellaceae bacterium]|nr:ABC transporter permease [Afifellaceae bacterium]